MMPNGEIDIVVGEPDIAAPWFARHGREFIAQLKRHSAYAQEDFEQIERIAYKRGFTECMELAEFVIETQLEALSPPPRPRS